MLKRQSHEFITVSYHASTKMIFGLDLNPRLLAGCKVCTLYCFYGSMDVISLINIYLMRLADASLLLLRGMTLKLVAISRLITIPNGDYQRHRKFQNAN